MSSVDIEEKKKRIDEHTQKVKEAMANKAEAQPLIPYLSDCFNQFATSWFALNQQLLMAMKVPDDVELTLNDEPMTEEQRQGFKAGVEFCLEQMGAFKNNPLNQAAEAAKQDNEDS